MTKAVLFLQLGYALGFACMPLAGSKKRWRASTGWGLGLLSEVFFGAWAIVAHVWSALPWVLAWSTVYAVNYVKWHKSTASPTNL